MPLDKDTALDLRTCLAELINQHVNGIAGISQAAIERATAALAAADADSKLFRPGTPGLHANVTDFGMSIELAYVCLPVPDAPVVQFLRDHENFRRNGIQRDTPQTVVGKLRLLAKWIEEHAA